MGLEWRSRCINREGNLFTWLSTNFLLSALVFYLVFVAENYAEPAAEGPRPVAQVGLRLQLENQNARLSLSPVSATQAAFLALGGVEAALSTGYSVGLLPGLPRDDTVLIH